MGAVIPDPATASSKPLRTRSASLRSDALRMVAFSRSRSPTRPISRDSDTETPGIASRKTSAAADSMSPSTGEKTEVMATDETPALLTSAATRRSSPTWRADISRPSNSCPPRHTYTWLPSALRRLSGQSTMGGTDRVAGAPRRTAAVGAICRASTTAFVKWVVPIITARTVLGSVVEERSISRRADVMPEDTSDVVGVLQVLMTRRPSIRTASVLVPPTSIPSRI